MVRRGASALDDGSLLELLERHDARAVLRACRRVRNADLRGVRARSAQTLDGAGRELAWFPATVRSRARAVMKLDFDEWYWG